MSHVSTYAQKITDVDLFCQTAKDKGYEANIFGEKGKVGLYGSNQVEAIAWVKIDGWRYPLAITADGEVKYDHFGSKQGTMELLGELCQDYNQRVVEKHIDYSMVDNYYTEQLPNGDRKLVLEYGT